MEYPFPFVIICCHHSMEWGLGKWGTLSSISWIPFVCWTMLQRRRGSYGLSIYWRGKPAGYKLISGLEVRNHHRNHRCTCAKYGLDIPELTYYNIFIQTGGSWQRLARRSQGHTPSRPLAAPDKHHPNQHERPSHPMGGTEELLCCEVFRP